jgi:hypothetical protein
MSKDARLSMLIATPDDALALISPPDTFSANASGSAGDTETPRVVPAMEPPDMCAEPLPVMYTAGYPDCEFSTVPPLISNRTAAPASPCI